MSSPNAGAQGKSPQGQQARIGLLLCGDTPEALQPKFGTYAECLVQRFQLGAARIRVWHVHKGELPRDVGEADAYLVGGSPASVFDQHEWIAQLTGFIRRAHVGKRRLAGICFGHQIIHHALGGRVERAAQGWGIGVYSVGLTRKLPKLPVRQQLSLPAMHRDQVVQPAPDLNRYAGSDFCPNYLTGLEGRVLTLQGHPEFTIPFLDAFLSVSSHRFDAQVLERARSSLLLPEDSKGMCHVIRRFLLAAPQTAKEPIRS
nr:type 1 glutamine amidotransferase [uncultured Roseovarius sp.]